MKRLKKGYIHLYTGSGKGKTTAAIGLAARALGAGYRVCIVQFLKGCTVYNEIKALQRLSRKCTVIRFRQVHPLFCAKKKTSKQVLQRQVEKDFQRTREIVGSKKHDVVVLDEIINLAVQGFLRESDLIGLIKKKPKNLELILTGRGASQRLKQNADYVTEMKLLKHPYYRGITARPGIEY